MRKIKEVVRVGDVSIGGIEPVVVQSMTDTPTADVESTLHQVLELYAAGSEIVRITINDKEAAKAVVKIRDKLLALGKNIPLAGCFHYNAHVLLKEVPECAIALDKYRINPGNVGGTASSKEDNFKKIIGIALKHNKPIRIGVNSGSIDKILLRNLMDENSSKDVPDSSRSVMREAIVLSAMNSAKEAIKFGMPKNKIIISAKLSNVQDLIWVYRKLDLLSDFPLHLGLTEAGMGSRAVVNITAALSILLNEGIGNTIRASITPSENTSRTFEVNLCKKILQALDLSHYTPDIISCPGCGRTSSKYFKTLANRVQDYVDKNINKWIKIYPKIKNTKIAIMGCIVNGPGESKNADIGISLPGSGEERIAVVYIKGKKVYTLRGGDILNKFLSIIDEYVRINAENNIDA